jgi:hypothetical protein
MNGLVLAGILGGIGGLTRAVVGLLKALSQNRKIIWPYFFMTLGIAIVIGVFLGLLFSYDYRLNLLAGYAGTDLLEGLYKSFRKRFLK